MRIHNSGTNIKAVAPVDQGNVWGRKPRGLWYAFDNSWAQHVQEHKHLKAFKSRVLGAHNFEVTVLDESKILIIDSLESMLQFANDFAKPLPWANEGAPGNQCVFWADVAKRWAGIEIREFYTASRVHMPWLDTDWDVPSGCIWAPAGVISISRIQLESEPASNVSRPQMRM